MSLSFRSVAGETDPGFPILFNFLPNYPPCKTSEEYDCMRNFLVKFRENRYKCLQYKSNIEYKARFLQSPKMTSNQTEVKFRLYFVKESKEIKEEVLIVTPGNLIGSIGGSLGLFLGFSFFSYLSELIDKIF